MAAAILMGEFKAGYQLAVAACRDVCPSSATVADVRGK